MNYILYIILINEVCSITIGLFQQPYDPSCTTKGSPKPYSLEHKNLTRYSLKYPSDDMQFFKYVSCCDDVYYMLYGYRQVIHINSFLITDEVIKHPEEEGDCLWGLMRCGGQTIRTFMTFNISNSLRNHAFHLDDVINVQLTFLDQDRNPFDLSEFRLFSNGNELENNYTLLNLTYRLFIR